MTIEKNEVHVWEINLGSDLSKVEKYLPILSDEEKKKASAFRFSDDRERYIISHAVLRLLLSKYSGEKPEEIVFYNNNYGKPYIMLNPDLPKIFFNISHSHKMAVIAISNGYEIGIDIEYLLRKINFEDIARRFFSNIENKKLNSLSGNLRKEAFFRCWTRKEAYLKAKGVGISGSFKSFEVSIFPEENPEIIAIDGQHSDEDNWSLFDIIHIHNYIGAIAVKGNCQTVKFFKFQFTQPEECNLCVTRCTPCIRVT
ncbi:MAG: 4'-phosphopantetheinyl transferase superfamily protein [Nitrospirae bacterium]|jgi:4'-phosphopantetheinyl transferase|nr:4'-phosphopantetheinyl transferase superfamily protein [Nitrospirota bacterium]